MRKHVAAALYGVGARLDHEPELLFLLRGVDSRELISMPEAADLAMTGTSKEKIIAEDDLAGIFGIKLDSGVTSLSQEPPEKPKQAAAGKENSAPVLPSKSPKRRAALHNRRDLEPAKPEKGRRPSRKVAEPATTTAKPARGRKTPPKDETAATGNISAKNKTPAGRKGVMPSTDTPPKRRGRPPGRKDAASPIASQRT